MSPLYRGGLGADSGGAGGDAGGVILDSVALSSAGPSLSTGTLDLADWLYVQVVTAFRANAAGEGTGDWVRTMMRFNDDAAAAHYIWGTQTIDGTNVDNDDAGFANGIELLHGSGTDFSASYRGTAIADLYLPGSSSLYKSVTYQGGTPYTTNVLGGIGSGYWLSTAAITKITVVSNDGIDFSAGRIDVIGMALA